MASPPDLLGKLLRQFSWRELTHHPWRNAAAVVAVMLGVALAFSTQLINASALSEFSTAVRAVNGQPDLELRAVAGSFDEAIFERVANHPQVAVASPVLELTTFALVNDQQSGKRSTLRVIGLDALVLASLAPALMPIPSKDADRFALFSPGSVFLNASARQSLPDTFKVQNGLQLIDVTLAGSVAAGGAALAVMDLGAAQDLFDKRGQLSRIDLRLKPGTDRTAFIESLALPSSMTIHEPGDAAERVSNLSRAYRVNLTVLALVALFTGAFLVFSVLSLSVAKRAQQFALLGVLGMTGRERLWLVLVESGLLGLLGSALGLLLGTGLAALALRVLGGDLGGGYFSGVAPPLQFSLLAALAYGALGVAACLVGGWWPARAAQGLPPAQTLKGLGAAPGTGKGQRSSLALLCGQPLALRHQGLDRCGRWTGSTSAGVWHSTGGLCVCCAAAGRRYHCPALAGRAFVRQAQSAGRASTAALAGRRACPPRASQRGGGCQRRGGVAQSGGRSDGDGGQLS